MRRPVLVFAMFVLAFVLPLRSLAQGQPQGDILAEAASDDKVGFKAPLLTNLCDSTEETITDCTKEELARETADLPDFVDPMPMVGCETADLKNNPMLTKLNGEYVWLKEVTWQTASVKGNKKLRDCQSLNLATEKDKRALTRFERHQAIIDLEQKWADGKMQDFKKTVDDYYTREAKNESQGLPNHRICATRLRQTVADLAQYLSDRKSDLTQIAHSCKSLHHL